MPLISVIIPVYNGEKTIRETIESVLNQTFSDLELIIINDGSSDATLDVISSIKDARLKFFSFPNAGQAASRNRGNAYASGEYISFIDADDLWTPDKLELQLKAIESNPQAAVAYSWTDWIDESGKFLATASHTTVNGYAYPKLLLIDFVAGGSNVLIRQDAFNAVGGFNESLPPAEDWDLWLRLAECYDFVAVPLPQILYRQSSNSASANVWKMEASSLEIISRCFAEAPAILQQLKQPCIANRYKYLSYKALEGMPDRKRGLTAIRFMWQAVINDPILLKTRVIWKVVFKIATVVLLSPKIAKKVLTKFSKLSQIQTLLIHIQTELPSELQSCRTNPSYLNKRA